MSTLQKMENLSIVLAEIILRKKNIESGHCCDLKRAVFFRIQLPDLFTDELSVLKTIKDVYMLLKDITLYVVIYIVVFFFFKDFLPQGHRHYQEPSDNQQWISPSCLP